MDALLAVAAVVLCLVGIPAGSLSGALGVADMC